MKSENQRCTTHEPNCVQIRVRSFFKNQAIYLIPELPTKRLLHYIVYTESGVWLT